MAERESVSRNENGSKADLLPEYLTAGEVAAILKVSEGTVYKRFGNQPGVIDLGTPGSRYKRRKRALRISREVLDKFLIGARVSNSGPNRST
jgi:hypothetical protein